MDEVLNESNLADRFLKHWGRHFVSLIFRFQAIVDGEPSHLQTVEPHSGFVVELEDEWHLIVAGHALIRIRDLLTEGKITGLSTCLGDLFGEGVKIRDPIPFDYDGADKFFMEEDEYGLDFGIVRLREFFRRSITANGVEAIPFTHWQQSPNSAFIRFAIYGLPARIPLQQIDLRVTRTGQISVSETMAFLEQLPDDEIPDDKQHEGWFIARIGSADRLPDIKGMSGGPIFGFYIDRNGDLRYKLVAIQSGWNPSTRIVYACTMARFIEFFRFAVESHPNESEG
jgi:hypothetical protein